MNSAKRTSRTSRVTLADVLELFSAATHATVTSFTRAGAPVRNQVATEREVLDVDGHLVVMAGLTTGTKSTLDLSGLTGAAIERSGELTVFLPGNVKLRIQLEHRRAAGAIAKAA